MICESCRYCGLIRSVTRGLMDADPEEPTCKYDFVGLSEDGEECEDYCYEDNYE